MDGINGRDSRDLRLKFLEKTGGFHVFVKRAGFELRHPDADQVARDVMAPGQPVKGLASEIFLSNLSLELNTVGSVLGHGFHPLKAQRSRSIPNVQPVHPQGRTPIGGQY